MDGGSDLDWKWTSCWQDTHLQKNYGETEFIPIKKMSRGSTLELKWTSHWWDTIYNRNWTPKFQEQNIAKAMANHFVLLKGVFSHLKKM